MPTDPAAPPPDPVTPHRLFLNRRRLLRAGVLTGSVAATAGLYRFLAPAAGGGAETKELGGLATADLSHAELVARGWDVDEARTPYDSATNYNNFYEFTTSKPAVAAAAADFTTDGWTVEVGGMVEAPRTFTLPELKALAPLEERVYRMRCVEAWSMVIPWAGIPLSALLDAVRPTAGAMYVAFETLLDPSRMPGQHGDALDWPYLEGLRLDEARNPLAILAFGLYGRELPPQNGAPVRLVTPWKYGFKGIKSIVKVTLTDMQPPSTWHDRAPREYGFLANVNPAVDHPRWTQATEQRIGEVRPPPDAAVQRVRRAGGPPVREHGPPGELLSAAALPARPPAADAAGRWTRQFSEDFPVSFWRLAVVVNGFVPLAILALDAATGGLGAGGVNTALHVTGLVSLVFLVGSLAVTPVRVLTGWNGLIAVRRALGLFAFLYAAAHVAIYVALDQGGVLAAAWEELLARRYLQVGAASVLLMVPLAATSTDGMIRRLGPRKWKLLHRLAYVAAILGVLHYYMLVKSDVTQPLAFGFVLAPLLGFRAAKHYRDLRVAANRPPAAAAAKPRFFRGPLTVARIFTETPDVKTFRFAAPDGGELPFEYAPGQYLTVTLPTDAGPLRRSYTISSAPTRRGYCEITVKREPDGLGSRHLHDRVEEGDALPVAAPAGKFTFDGVHDAMGELLAERPPGVVLIAGGVGLTPVLSILRSLTDRGWPGNIYVVTVMRTAADEIRGAELRETAARFPNVRLLRCLSREADAADGSHVGGRLAAGRLAAFVPDLRTLPVFLCGSEPMMAATRELLESLGVPAANVATEAFVPGPAPGAEPGADAGGTIDFAAVAFERSGLTVTIPGDRTVLDAAEQVGAALPWECRSGICGQCKVRCTAGAVFMATRDALTDGERADGFILACQSVPRSPDLTVDA